MPIRTLATLCILLLGLATTALSQPVTTVGPKELRGLIDASAGRVLIVNYWATWCGPCVQELPGLVALRKHFSEADLNLVGISIDNDQRTVTNFLARRPVNYPVYLDDGTISSMLSISSIPRTMIYDRQGKKVLDRLGLMDEDDLTRIVQHLLETP